MTSLTSAQLARREDTPTAPGRSSAQADAQGTGRIPRPHGAPPYYLGRPATVWLAAFGRTKRQVGRKAPDSRAS
jgi:hypothetical protein